MTTVLDPLPQSDLLVDRRGRMTERWYRWFDSLVVRGGTGVVGPQGPAGPAGATGATGAAGPPGGSSSVFHYRADANTTTASDPGSGFLRWNAVPQTAATMIYFDRLTTDGFDVTAVLQSTGAATEILIQDTDFALNNQKFFVAGAAISYPDWFAVPVTFDSASGSGASFTHTQRVSVVTKTPGTPGATGPMGPTGATGPAGPAPAGTGYAHVTSSLLDPAVPSIPQADVTGLVTTLAAKAPIASPALTGNVQVAGCVQIGSAAGLSPSVPAWRNTASDMECVLGDASTWATTRAARFVSVNPGTSLTDLTVSGAANLQAGLSTTVVNATTGYYCRPGQGGAAGNIFNINWTAGGADLWIDVTNVGTIVTQSSGQLKFPATENASADPNTLDDYEEGVWTPILGGASSQSGQTYSYQGGSYLKIGSKVLAGLYLQFSNKGTISGGLVVKGLPFASGGGSPNYAASIGYMTNMASGTIPSKHMILGYLNGGAIAINMLAVNDFVVQNPTQMDGTDVNNTTQLVLSMSYRTNY